MRKNLRPGIAAGSLAIVSFGSTLVALRYAPVAIVSALRETCILVSLLLAWFWMKERLTLPSLTAAVLIVAGALLLMLPPPFQPIYGGRHARQAERRVGKRVAQS